MIDVTATLSSVEVRLRNLEAENTKLHEELGMLENIVKQLHDKLSTSPEPLMNIEEIKKERTNVKIIIGS